MKTKELIDKFYAGETSLEEEALLVEFFENSDSPEFDYFDYNLSRKQISLPDSFDEKVLEQISRLDNKQSTKPKLEGWRLWLSSAAAVLLVLTGALTIYNFANQQKAVVINDSNLADNRTKAVEETRKALEILSGSIEIADENINKLRYINKKDESLEILNSIFGSNN